jgi:2-polyprenyl-3-methyl-5-hydroxy-6-metoxy-1,4-benzoquinol methylase
MSRQKLHLADHLNHHTYPWFLMKWPKLIHLVYGWNHLFLQRNWAVRSELKKELKNMANGTVLDAGCGEGLFVFPYAKRFSKTHFIGLDKNKDHLNFCKNYQLKTGLKNIDFFRKELTQKIELENIGLILCIGTLQYIEDDVRVINNFHQLLNDMGKVIIYVPINGRIIMQLYRKYFSQKNHYEKSQNRVRIYSEIEIMEKIKKAGFNILHKKYTYGKIGIAGHEIYSILLIKISSGKWYSFLYILLLFILTPIIFLLTRVDYFLKKQNGNGLLIVAQK